MDNRESELMQHKQELHHILNAIKSELAEIEAEENREANIKRHYQRNIVEPKYKMDWRGVAQTLIDGLLASAANDSTKKSFESFIHEAKLSNCVRLPDDPVEVYNCPKCGESKCLHVGEYLGKISPTEYAVTCSRCDFVGPKISDYGEAWVEFEDWLKQNGYLD